MLTLILGDIGSGKTTRLVNAITQDVEKGIRSFLIVPEQKTVTAERNMSELLPPSSCLTFEVTNFTRLCDTIFRLCGGLAGDVCDKNAEQLIMWRTMSELAPLLTTLKHHPDGASAQKMRATIRELQSRKLSPALLQVVAKQVEQEELKHKLEDYALIWSIYNSLIGEHFSDAESRLDKCIDALTANAPLKDYHIYIDDFTSYTEQELEMISALVGMCDVTITLSMPPVAQKQLCADEVLLTKERFARLASQKGVEMQVVTLEQNLRTQNEAIQFALANLWRVDLATLPSYTGGAKEDFSLIETAEPSEACHFIAADILRRVQTTGARFSDFAIVCGNPTSYAGVLDMILERNDIPYFFSHPKDTASLAPVKAILSAYSIFSRGWQKEDVISYLKCGMSGIDASVCDEIELYAETWNLQGKGWYHGDSWDMGPDGYGDPHTEGRRTYVADSLSRMNEARAQFIPPLRTLEAASKGEHSVTEHICALMDFLLAIQLPQTIAPKKTGHQQEEEGKYGQLWNTLCDLFDIMSNLLGDMQLIFEDFANIFKMLVSSKSLSHLPARVDEVTIGQASLLRSEGVKHVYLLGAQEGVLPGVVKDDGAFTEQERLLLEEIGVGASDSLDIRSARELFAFRRAMGIAKESLCVLWSRADTTMAPVSPSSAVYRLRTMMEHVYPVRYLGETETPDLIWSAGAAFERLGQSAGTEMGEAIKQVLVQTPAQRGAVEALSTPICNNEQSLSPQVAQMLYPGNLSLTQSRISAFLKCPFSHFCNYTLGLKEGRKAEFDSMNIGNFVHALLEGFFKLARDKKLDIHHLDVATQEALLDEILPPVLQDALPPREQKEPRTQYIIGSLVNKTKRILASMCEELSFSKFEPAFFELKIDTKNPKAPAPVAFTAQDGSKIFIYGTIDRVDKLVVDNKVYLRVIDYKTGSEQITQEAVRDGSALQMPLYLFSLLGSTSKEFRGKLGCQGNEELLPAGVMYLSSLAADKPSDKAITTPDAAWDAAQKNMVHSGLFLYDEEILTAMDSSPARAFIKVKPNSDGEYNKYARKHLLTLEEFDTLLADMGSLLTDIGAKIKGGVAEASPMKSDGYNSSCDKCSYKPICRHVTRKKEDDDGGEE